MSTYSISEMTEIYKMAFNHIVRNIEKNVTYDHSEYMSHIIDVAKFASLIFDDSDEAQKMAKYYKEMIEMSHKEMMEMLENGEHVHVCICIKENIDKIVNELQNEDENNKDFEKWLAYSDLILDD
jgi:hypothetical protein